MGKKPLLVVDGICGPLTTAAIHEFQQDFVSRSKDSRIDPQGATLRVLIYSYITIMRLGVYRTRPFPASFTLLAAQEQPDGCDYGKLMHRAFMDLKRGITPLLGPRKGAPPAPRGRAPERPPKPSTQIDLG